MPITSSGERSAEIAWKKGARVVTLPTVPFGVNTGQPGALRRIDCLVLGNAPHLPPDARVDDLVRGHVAVPDTLPRRLKRVVPKALAFGQSGLGALLPVDIDELDDDIERTVGGFAAQ